MEAALGRPRLIRRLESSPRSRVWLVEFDGEPAIVKQIVGGTDTAARFAREVIALRLGARARPAVVPALLGSDPDARVLVLEYVSHTSPSENWVVDYAVALARLHAVTGPADVGALPRAVGPTATDVEAFLRLARALDVPVSPRVATELADVCLRLGATTEHAMLHGDPCPGNDRHTSDGVRFVDLEQAALGSGLVELAYLRIGFPTCWCVTTTSLPLREQAELAYRDEWRATTGTEVGGDLADACAGWLIQGDALVEKARRGTVDHLARVADRDWKWGSVSARQRLVYRTAVVAALGAEHAELGEVGRLSQALHDRMVRCWPQAARTVLPTGRPRDR